MSDGLSTYFGKCRCCLNYGYLKSMWSEYYNEDVVEIYGEMLVQCFALLFERSENESPYEEDKICDSCVVKLRDAYMFKKSILESQEKLMNQIEDGDNTVQSDIIVKSEIEDESFIELDNQSGSTKDHNAAVETANIIFQDVEFLEEDNGEPKMAVTGDKRLFVTFETSTQPSTEDKPVKKRQCPKKLPKCEQYKTCKQYTAEDLQECMEAVFAEKLTPKQASVLYKIPKKTIESKLKALKTDGNNSMKSEIILEQSGTEGESFTVLDNQSGRNKQSVDFKCKSKGYNARVETANIIYHDVEFLEEDDHETKMAVTVPVVTSTQPNTEGKPVKKRKWPQKLPKNERYKTYKQYTVDDLRMCLEAVSAEELTPQQASILYKIPKKTIEGKLRASKAESKVNPSKEKNYNFIQELKVVLSYTNATPYKSVANRYYCLYCSTDGPVFDNPDELRSHTRTVHVNERTARIEFVLRPIFLYEIVKLDIANLLCNVCCVIIDNWNEMFKHLRDTHNVNLDQAYNRLIPYILDYNFNCALCKKSFSNYTHLDSHMNAHYDNHICPDCGDSFMTSYRINQHNKIHVRGKFPCRYCTKVFALEKYRRKHEAIMHEHTSKFKCMYCNENFDTKHSRHLHILDAHSDKASVITCELCGKIFKWRSYYLCHMRKVHADRNEEHD